GADVVATGRRVELLDEVAGEIEALGRRTMRQAADVGSRKSIDAFRDAVLENFGRVDILLNAAGRTIRKPTIEITEEEWSGILDTNLTGILRTCQSFFEPLRASGRGRIINIAWPPPFVHSRDAAAYCASTAAVLSLTQRLAADWAP